MTEPGTKPPRLLCGRGSTSAAIAEPTASRLYWNGSPLLLLTTLGRRSGQNGRPRHLLRPDGDDYLIVAASQGGAPHPSELVPVTQVSNPQTVHTPSPNSSSRASIPGDRLPATMLEAPTVEHRQDTGLTTSLPDPPDRSSDPRGRCCPEALNPYSALMTPGSGPRPPV